MEQDRDGQTIRNTSFGGNNPGSDFGGTARGDDAGTHTFSDNDEPDTRPGFSAADTHRSFSESPDDRSSFDRPGEPAEGASTIQSGKNRIADQIHNVGKRLEDRARNMEQSGGVQGRAGHIAVRAGEALETGADYVRNHEVDEMRDDLEDAIRLRPLLSVGIAAGVGFLLARILRD